MNKPILALNAFDMNAVGRLGDSLGASVARRGQLFGAATMLFYDQPLELVRGEGCWLYDAGGTPYLDAYNNVASVGHCHPDVVAAVTRQLTQLNVHSRYLHPGIMHYAEQLLATVPAELSNITFTCTGSESNDLALRLAASFTGGEGVIVTAGAYHGNTSLTTQISPSAYKSGSPPAHVRVVPAPESCRAPASVAATFAGHVAAAIADFERHEIRLSALIVDTIFSSDGIYSDPPGFLRPAVELVHRHHGLLIADEVQPGFGRTGASLWGFQRHRVVPDIVTLGKPMGNGYPIGAVITRPEILDVLCREVGYFNTYAASPVAAAAGQAVLDVIHREGLLQTAAEVGQYLKKQLTELSTRHPAIGEVRGAGLYVGVELLPPTTGSAAPASAIINAMRERRILIGAAGRFGNVLKLRPPLCFSAAHADQLVAALDDVLTQAPQV